MTDNERPFANIQRNAMNINDIAEERFQSIYNGTISNLPVSWHKIKYLNYLPRKMECQYMTLDDEMPCTLKFHKNESRRLSQWHKGTYSKNRSEDINEDQTIVVQVSLIRQMRRTARKEYCDFETGFIRKRIRRV